MAKYKATFGFNDVLAFRKALKVYKAILEAQSESEIVLNGNDDTYEKVCKALESVERHLDNHSIEKDSKEENESLRAQITELEKENESLRAQITELKKENENLKTENTQPKNDNLITQKLLVKKIEQLEKENTALKEELNACKKIANTIAVNFFRETK